jgi:hypothetical protein
MALYWFFYNISHTCYVQEKELNSAYAKVMKLEQQLANIDGRFHVSFLFPSSV